MTTFKVSHAWLSHYVHFKVKYAFDVTQRHVHQ
ncbi:Uncharacterised protein [Vibrio cholerae]|nr:Uncharacterised protein [Vibrio cholerae]CSI44092.1 Uncharacterised protein [Vibrio cholerae]